MVKLGEAAPALHALRRRMAALEIHSEDLPAAYVRFLYGMPENTIVTSRVDQLQHAEGECAA